MLFRKIERGGGGEGPPPASHQALDMLAFFRTGITYVDVFMKIFLQNQFLDHTQSIYPCIYEKYLFSGQALDKMAFFRDKH